MKLKRKIKNAFLIFSNAVLNKVPSRHFRRYIYRLLGAKIGKSFIFRNTEILEPGKLIIGNASSIGWHCLLDARGGLSIGNNVNISSYVKIISVGHDVRSPFFQGTAGKIIIDDDAWLSTGCMVLEGVHIGKGAVVAAGAVVLKDVPPFTVVGGIPAKKISERCQNLNYTLIPPPILY